MYWGWSIWSIWALAVAVFATWMLFPLSDFAEKAAAPKDRSESGGKQSDDAAAVAACMENREGDPQ